MACLDETTIQHYALGRLSAAELDEVVAHADECSSCHALLAGALLADESARGASDDPGSAPTLPEAHGVLPPEIWSWERYRILTLIGSGGSGDVFKAYDPRLARPVAIKFLRGDHPRLARRFLDEARTQGRVDHPHVCKVHEIGTVARRHFIVMQYIDGRTLAVCARELDREARLRVMKQIAEAVQAAHGLGIVHRDLKPTNVLVEESDDGRCFPYVMDFGLARDLSADDTTSTAFAGTPAYMAPEQARGDTAAVDRRTDVYALGATLYHVLLGRPPLVAASTAEVIAKVLHDEPPAPRRLDRALPADVEAIVLKCLEKDPARRYPSARALAEDLGRYLNGDRVEARAPTIGYRLGRWARRHRAAAAVGAAVIAGFAALGVVALDARRAAAERERVGVELGEVARELEAWMRMQRLLPPHDLTAALDGVRARMQAIDERRRQLGAAAEGTGHYALGRGHLELGEYEEARVELERAWHAGFREPQAAWALARAFTQLYDAELDGRPEPDAAAESARRAELARLYRAPALEYLRAAAGARVESPLLIEALIAYNEERFEDAVAKARAAAAAAPWLYEAPRLEGAAWSRLAAARAVTGGVAAARAPDEAAADAFRRALAIGRSDDASYAGECARRAAGAAREMAHGIYVEADVTAAASACARVAAINPHSGDGELHRARLLVLVAGWFSEHGRDPAAPLAAAEQAVNALVAVHDSWRARQVLADFYGERASFEAQRSRDAARWLRLQIAMLEHVASAHPSAETFAALGVALFDLAKYTDGRYGDPLPLYDRARDWLERADRLPRAVDAPPYLAALGGVYTQKAAYEANHGRDPTASYERALAIARRAVAAQPQSATAYNNLAATLNGRAEYLAMTGSDATPLLDECEPLYRRAMDLDEGLDYLHANFAEAERLRAEQLLAAGRDPGPALARARAELDAVGSSGDGASDRALIGARLDVIAARRALAQHRSADGALRRAYAEAARAGTSEGWYRAFVLAEVQRWQAESSGGGALLDRAIAAAREAARLATDTALPKRLLAELLIAKARAASAPDRVGLGAEAKRLLADVLRVNANESRRCAAAQAEASRLATP